MTHAPIAQAMNLGRTRPAATPFRRGFLVPAELKRPHPIRRTAILRAHPEVRALMGQDPWTFAVTLGAVAGQFALAGLMGHLGLGHWWVALAAAWCVGAFV